MVPDLRLEGLGKCGLYLDCWTNDSRLTLANVVGGGLEAILEMPWREAPLPAPAPAGGT